MIGLDRHLEILLLSNDCVIVPGFGGFMAHHVEARKDGADGMFLPPTRTIGFNPKLTFNDSLLAQSYVECYDISYPDALNRIDDEVRELRQHIENDGSYYLHGVGVVTLNKEGHYVFEPCEAGILTPSLYGLSGFELPTLHEMSHRETTHVIAGTTGQSCEESSSSLSDEVNEGEVSEKTSYNVVMIWRTIAAACVAALILLLYPSSLDNNRQIVSAEMINVDLLQRVLPKTEVEGAGMQVKGIKKIINVVEKSDEMETAKVSDANLEEGFVIVLASRVNLDNAQSYVKQLRDKGYKDVRVIGNPGNIKVAYGFYAKQDEAYDVLQNLRKNAGFEEAWIMKHCQ